MDEIFCPNCHATIDTQVGFDENKKVFMCRKCGTFLASPDLYNGDRFPGVIWICDKCGAVLNEQVGFTDKITKWKCKKCSFENSIAKDNIKGNKPGILDGNNPIKDFFNGIKKKSKQKEIRDKEIEFERYRQNQKQIQSEMEKLQAEKKKKEEERNSLLDLNEKELMVELILSIRGFGNYVENIDLRLKELQEQFDNLQNTVDQLQYEIDEVESSVNLNNI